MVTVKELGFDESLICRRCGKELSEYRLCGYHNTQFCGDCNRCNNCMPEELEETP